MKKLFPFLFFIPFCLNLYAQSPEKMSYQAVIRDAGNVLITNQTISIQISVLQGSPTGPSAYTETHSAITNINGLVSIEIGAGTTSDDFSLIDWNNGPYFIKTETDPLGGTNYTIAATSQLLTVPYSLYSNTALNVLNDAVDDADADPANELITNISLNGTVLETTDAGGTITTDLSPLQNDGGWTVVGSDVINTDGGNVGINSDGSNPQMKLDIKTEESSDGIRINNTSSGAGDPIINFQIDGSDKFTMGVDDSNGDRFKITSESSTLNSTPLLSIESTGNFGLNLNNPDNTLDVSGDAQISEHLRVGNPSTPSSVSSAKTNLYSVSLEEMDAGITSANNCGLSFWQFIFNSASDKNYILFNNSGSSSVAYMYTPWIWVPTGSGDIQVLLTLEFDLETDYDGVYAEYWDGSTWVKLENTDIEFGTQYSPTPVDLSNSNCSGTDAQSAWSGSDDYGITIFNISNLAENWTRLRLVGAEDQSADTGTGFKLYSISIDADLPSFGGGFQAGNIYAENNVYAGSNVLLGDLAEYFPLSGSAQKGDIISMVDINKEMYIKSGKAYDSKVIGIYSSNPTLTLNDPNSGVPVALQGRVPVNVSNERGEIKKGDYLTSASKSGHAMKADKPCFVIGRALEDFNKESGSILCLVETGWRDIPIEELSNDSYSTIGNATIKARQKSFTVKNNSVQDESMVFITMLADPGSRYWLSNVKDHEFTVNLSQANEYDLPFNYRIEKARKEITTSVNSQINEKVSEEYTWDKTTHKCFYKGVEVDPKEVPKEKISGTSMPLAEETGANPPMVDDKTKIYTWSTSKGLKRKQ